MRIHVDLGSTEASVLRSRGIPNGINGRSFELDDHLTTVQWQKTERSKPRIIHRRDQNEMLETTLKHPLKGSYLYLMGTDSNESRMQSVALTIFREAYRQHLNDPLSFPVAPYWHPVYGGFEDKLRDDKNFREGVGHVSMLILDNVAVNSTASKVEKVRDLVRMYEEVPRIVLVSGMNPMEFASKTLHMRPHRVLYLGEQITEH